MRIYTIIFFLLILSICVNGVYVDDKVNYLLNNNTDVNVIIKFTDKSELLKKDFNANSIVSNLNRDEFDGKFYKNSNIAAGRISRKGIEKLNNNFNVERIDFDYVMKINLNDSNKMVNSTIVNTLRVNGNFNVTGKGISVCVLDTGVNYSLSNLGGGLGKKVLAGYDFANSDTDPMDDNGHGTHIAGIIASNGTLTGVAPDANIIAIKILDSSGGGLASSLMNGIQWCIDNATKYNISVITMSLGCGTFTNACDADTNCNADLIKTYVNDAVSKNITVISSSGNNGDGTQGAGNSTAISAPACLSNVVSVGAVDKSYLMASYGNRNNLSWLVAPGSSIKSLRFNPNSCLSGCTCSGETMTCSGTSMAAPHAAGIFALMRQYLRDENNSLMTNSQLKDLLNSTGTPIVDSVTGLTYMFTDSYKALLRLDTHAPYLNIFYPENKTYGSTNLSFNFSSLDVTLNSTWYNVDNGNNITLTSNTSVNLSNGNHIINLFANDTNGNFNSTNLSFVINTNLPVVTLNEPSNNSFNYDGNVTFNCSSTSNTEFKNVSLWHNVTGNFILNETKTISGLSNYSLFNLTNLNNTKIIWNCLFYNTNESYSFGENRTLNIKINHKPNVTSYLPNLTISVDEGKSLSFNHTSIDSDSDTLIYYWYLDSNLKSSSQNYTYSPNYTEAGNYILSLVVSDSIVNTSLNWSLTVNNIINCGNNVKETGESCDTNDLDSKTCNTQGFTGGSLSCSVSCIFVTSSCTNSTNSGGGSSSGSGGGSSSGGNPISTSEFDQGLILNTPNTLQEQKKPVPTTPSEVVIEESGRSINLIKGETSNFVFSGNKHSITLDDIKTDFVDITVNSKTVKLTLKLNEEKLVDVGEKDQLKIKLEKISSDEVSLKISKFVDASFKANADSSGKLITGKFFTNLGGLGEYSDEIKNYGLGLLGLILIIFVFRWGIRRNKKML